MTTTIHEGPGTGIITWRKDNKTHRYYGPAITFGPVRSWWIHGEMLTGGWPGHRKNIK